MQLNYILLSYIEMALHLNLVKTVEKYINQLKRARCKSAISGLLADRSMRVNFTKIHYSAIICFADIVDLITQLVISDVS